MVTINFYCVFDNPYIQSDSIPIADSFSKLLTSIYNNLKNFSSVTKDEEVILGFALRYSLIAEKDTRVELLLNVYNIYSEIFCKDIDETSSNIKFHLVTPNGKVMVIKDFDKVSSNLEAIEKQCLDDYKDKDLRQMRLDTEQMRNKKANITTEDEVKYATRLGYIDKLMGEYIDTNEDKILHNMEDQIKRVREEQESLSEIKTELDILNHHIKGFVKDGNAGEFKRCIYNNRILTQEEMVDELFSHKLPEYMLPQKDINDTLDDEYEIELDNIIITRSKGGSINIRRI